MSLAQLKMIEPVADELPPAVAGKAFLELQGLSKSYGSGRHVSSVLKDINLKINEGEFVAIVGFSGSGKTTLISLIAGLIAPDAGAVLLGEVDFFLRTV